MSKSNNPIIVTITVSYNDDGATIEKHIPYNIGELISKDKDFQSFNPTVFPDDFYDLLKDIVSDMLVDAKDEIMYELLELDILKEKETNHEH